MKSQFIVGRPRSMGGNVYLVAHTDHPYRWSLVD